MTMRLYRGPKKPYRSELVPADRLSGTGFTDCPGTALRYAEGSRGVLLVLDVPGAEAGASPRVTEELGLGTGSAKRYMVWGKFDEFMIAILPARDLRAAIRREGLRGASDSGKVRLLRAVIDADDRSGAAVRLATASQPETST
jgi:hypothetical protein